MEELMKNKIYIDSGSYQREKEDLSHTLFENIDFTLTKRHVSFFRSDFRGSKFLNVHFFHNNFDRADFITCYLKDCKFDRTNIGASEFKSCYFSNVTFENNIYDNTSIQECTFENCSFPSERFLVNMKNCTFKNCTFKDCSFERSTTEKLSFIHCKISNSDFATMHAERHIFKSCTLDQVSMGISYIFGYLLHDTNINDIDILYRGEKVSLKSEYDLNTYSENLLKEQRYYEFINTYMIFNKFSDVPSLLRDALDNLLLKDEAFRKIEIINILNAFIFYGVNNSIPFNCFYEIINVLCSLSWEKVSFEERLEYISKCQSIELILTSGNYNESFIASASQSCSLVMFNCKTDDYEESLNITTKFLSSIYKQAGILESYTLLNAERGSWMLTFAVITACALLIPKVIKSYGDVYYDIKLKREFSKVCLNKLSSSRLRMSEMKELSLIATNTGLIGKNASGDEDISKSLSSIVELIKIGI